MRGEQARVHGYPRPQLRRPRWVCLNGEWDFAVDADARWRAAEEVEWASTIVVPFAPETPDSCVSDQTLYRACWYKRTFVPPALEPGERLVLHFGAVDFAASVWVNDILACQHTGGYTPF